MSNESTVIVDTTLTNFILSREVIDTYLKNKADQGVALVTIRKYRTPLLHLLQWTGDSSQLTAQKMNSWRQSLVEHGYSKVSIQKYVTIVNDFLRAVGQSNLCIPKPVRSDLAGKTFGYLTVLEATEKRHHRYVLWKCMCKCGREIEVPSAMLLGGHTTSCGCLNIEILQHCNRYEEGTELRQALEEKVYNTNSASGYVGVQQKRGKWVAYITYKKKRYLLGTYSNIEDAVKARARAKEAVMEDAARIYKETEHLYGEAPRRPPRPTKAIEIKEESTAIRARRTNNTSGYPGVTMQHDKWNASISVQGYRYRLGAYAELEDAIAARKKAETLVKVGDLEQLKAISKNWRK